MNDELFELMGHILLPRNVRGHFETSHSVSLFFNTYFVTSPGRWEGKIRRELTDETSNRQAIYLCLWLAEGLLSIFVIFWKCWNAIQHMFKGWQRTNTLCQWPLFFCQSLIGLAKNNMIQSNRWGKIILMHMYAWLTMFLEKAHTVSSQCWVLRSLCFSD